VQREILRGRLGGYRLLWVIAAACFVLLTGCLKSFTDDREFCGNGRLEPGEACDDGNTANGDACRADCLQNMTLCGNGTLELGETCDDGGTLPGDGCSETCQVETCSPMSCPWGCCDPQGTCLPGTQDIVCGTNGEACGDCEVIDAICREQVCQVPGACIVDETEPCGNCGTRECDSNATWGDCLLQGVCAPDQLEYGSNCGQCGHEERLCSVDCSWDGFTCVGESGECESGAVEVGAACGICQHEIRDCSAVCLWDSWLCTADVPETDCGLCVGCDGSGNCDDYTNNGAKDSVGPERCEATHFRCDGSGGCIAPEVDVAHDYCMTAQDTLVLPGLLRESGRHLVSGQGDRLPGIKPGTS